MAAVLSSIGRGASLMCELLGMSSNRVTTVDLSLMTLAEHGGFSGPHRDGWGVGYYEDADVRLIKEAEAAADSDWVRFIREHHLHSRMVIAHVRRATIGARAYRNTQPLVRELAGRMHLFAHNGNLPAIRDTPGFAAQRFAPIGETDSEWAFCALLGQLAELWQRPGETPPIESRMACVVRFAASLRPLGPANFLYADGDTLFAHGDRRKQGPNGRVAAPGLVVLARRCGDEAPALQASGVVISGGPHDVTLLASVALNDEPWQALSEGEVIAVRDGRIVLRQAAASGAATLAVTAGPGEGV